MGSGPDAERDCPCGDPTCLGGRAAGRCRDMEDDQLERFGEAVEQKKDEAREASERAGQTARGSEVDGDEADLTSAARPQDVRSVRDKSSGKGKKTADKWNQ